VQTVSAADFDRQNRQKMDETLLVRFFTKPRPDNAATAKEGRPIFYDCEYIEIRVPGSKDAVARPARQRDIDRFPRHYQAFKNRVEVPEEGTPLSEWPMISRSQVEELSFFNVKTVEQLVAMSDQNSTQFMGIQKLKQTAKDWLEETQGENAKIKKLEADLAERDEQIAALAERLEKLEAKPAPEKAPAKKKTAARRKKVTAKKE
jgi:hypothetical protein